MSGKPRHGPDRLATDTVSRLAAKEAIHGLGCSRGEARTAHEKGSIMTSAQAEPAGVEQGVAAGIERSRQFDLQPSARPELFNNLRELATEHPEAGPASLQLFSEVTTIADIGRNQYGQPALQEEDLRRAFSFWEWLFDGLVRR